MADIKFKKVVLRTTDRSESLLLRMSFLKSMCAIRNFIMSKLNHYVSDGEGNAVTQTRKIPTLPKNAQCGQRSSVTSACR